MANARSFTSLVLSLALFFCFITFNCSASTSTIIASDQLKFWSENVQNTIPGPILKKLSPLSRNDADYYSHLREFSVDAGFCSRAKLACAPFFGSAMSMKNTYTTEKAYNINRGIHQRNKNQQDPFSFFRASVLKTGNLVHLPSLQESIPDRSFLPTKIASKIPLTYEAIAKTFPDSVKMNKESIQTTLSYCDAAAIQGETKSCPKSLEEMVGFARVALGKDKKEKLLALTSANMRGSNTEMMIGKLKEYGTGKTVACHEAFLPFAAYFCHSLTSTRLYAVELVDTKTGAPVNTMMAICHMDTSPWPANHVAFQILKFGPGGGEACHWFTRVDLAWIAAADVSV